MNTNIVKEKEEPILSADSVLDIELIEIKTVCEMLKYSIETGAIDLVKYVSS